MNCSSLTSVIIGNGVTSIGANAFKNCSNLNLIDIPDSVTIIGDSALYGCSKLSTINIPESVTSIGKDAFDGCSSLASVTYKGNTYVQKTELESILKSNNVSLGSQIFDGTALKA